MDGLANEALDRWLASLPQSPDKTGQEFEAAKQAARDIASVSIQLTGPNGEQTASTSCEPLEEHSLPKKVAAVVFHSSAALQLENVQVPDWFSLTLDFSEPPLITNYDPWGSPTPNNSNLQISGSDSAWINSVRQTVSDFFKERKTFRAWLHTRETFNVLNWLLGIPGGLWLAYRVDALGWFPNTHVALRGAIYIYVILFFLLVFRSMISALRWAFPLVELEGSKSGKTRITLSAIALSLFSALIYDVVSNLVL